MKKVTCSACRFYMKELNRCGYHGADCLNADGERWCDKYKKPTLFDRITQSPEVLAENIVYEEREYSVLTEDGIGAIFPGGYTSAILDLSYGTKPEAIAATVAKLKEVGE